MAKRGLAFGFFLLATILFFPLAVRADVIWEPPDDFYNAHKKACKYLGRNFYINAERGYIFVKKEPGSEVAIGSITNGGKRYVSFTYDHQGEQWGLITLTGWHDSPTGWIAMDELVIEYDYNVFNDEHKDEYYTFFGDLSALAEVDELIYWTWPGSGEITVIDDDPAGREYFRTKQDMPAWKDSEGREWGYTSYTLDIKQHWVCISDPGNRDIPAFNAAVVPEFYSAIEPSELPPPDNRDSGLRIIVILVALLVASTAILILVLWKPKSENGKGKNDKPGPPSEV